MASHFAEIVQQLNSVGQAVVRFGGTASPVTYGEAATPGQLRRVAKVIGRAIPNELREFLAGPDGSVFFEWSLRDSAEPLPEGLRDVKHGSYRFDVGDLTEIAELHRDWANTHNASAEIMQLWKSGFAFSFDPAGDFLALDTRPESPGVVLLSESQPQVDGCRLGSSLADFVRRWVRLGCVGPDAEHLTPFIGADGRLDDESASAKLWKAWLHI